MANLSSTAQIPAGYTNRYALTSANGTTGQSLKTGWGVLGCVINSSGSAQTQTVSLYDANSVSDAVAANLIATITLTASQVQPYNFPFQNGLVVIAGGAVSGNVWITWS